MFNRTLHEILSTRIWMMAEQPFHAYSQVLRNNINNRIGILDLELEKKESDYRIITCKSGNIYYEDITSEGYSENTQSIPPQEEPESNVLVLHVEGPVTRSGDLCTYGSIDHRNMLLEASADEKCKGVVFCIDTPGGSAFSLHDYRQGLDALKEAGKRSISFIDGGCFSAGMAIACQTDLITVMNAKDEVGCIGSMMAGYLPVDGEITEGERFVYVTASQTQDKNLEFRSASEGDYSGLQELVDKSAQEFLDLIEEMRPQILPSQRTGKTYQASEVMGTMVDGISSFDDCVHYIATGEIELQYPLQEKNTTEQTETNNTQQNNMNYQNIMATLGVTELAVEETGIFLNADLVDKLDQALATKETPEVEETQETQEPQQTEVEETQEPQEPEVTEPQETQSPQETQEPQQPESEESQETQSTQETQEPQEPEVTEPQSPQESQSPQNLQQHFAEQLAALQHQHEQEMQQLRDEMESLRKEKATLESSTVPAPAPKNNGTTRASMTPQTSKPAKPFREMTMKEKQDYWESLGYKKKK